MVMTATRPAPTDVLDRAAMQSETGAATGAILRLDGVSKSFKDQVVLDELSLEVGRGEFLTFLGPSGCGKSTTLNIIAGLIKPDKGEVFLRDQMVNKVPPQRRHLGMVFQSWALFPHMTVLENVAYGLRGALESPQR